MLFLLFPKWRIALKREKTLLLQPKIIIRLAFLGSLVVWAMMTFFDLIILFSDIRDLNPGIPIWFPRAMMTLYVLLVFYYYKLRNERRKNRDSSGFLWQVFVIGLPVTFISLGVHLLLSLLGETKFSNNVIFIDIIYHIHLALFISFLIAAFTSWKRLILYQKSKLIISVWNAFEIILLLALLYDSVIINGNEYVEKITMVVLGIIILFLSINVKWIAYLNIKQKLVSLLLLLLIFFYLYYFRYTVTGLSDQIDAYSTSFIDFKSHAFSLSIFGFVMLYNVFSFFVILFNIPTSSAFEQKLGEVVSFKKISQSVQTEQNEGSIYRILLDSAVNSTFADAAWIDIKSIKGQNKLFTHSIEGRKINMVKKYLKNQNVEELLYQDLKQKKQLSNYMGDIRDDQFRSMLVFPLVVKNNISGLLVLLKELPSGFNREMTSVIDTFTNQARISIENFRLLEEAFQHERYKEELKIAKRVHKKLIPSKLEKDKDFDIATFSQSADGIGGDYYDAIRINDDQTALVIADVSGKGTTAAFHMAQMKGIFHSLARQGLNPDTFMLQANEALVSCLERGAFISAIYFIIDTRKKKIKYSRAGHCPVLYYNMKKNKSEYLKDKGTALGFIKNTLYSQFVNSNEIPYEPGDVMVLYTDGITEAKNGEGEEYGYDRLEKTLLTVKDKNADSIQEYLISKLYAYSGTNKITDDYTTMIVQFKRNLYV